MKSRSNLFLALGILCFAAVLIFLWIPFDIETGLTEKQRRRVVIGDALAPTVAGAFLLIGGLGLLVFERNSDDQPVLSASNMRFLIVALGITILAFVVMRYAGPIAVSLYNTLVGTELEYRLLRDTAPWKYIGYISGGTVLAAGLISLVGGRLTWKTIGIGLAAAIVLILIYDVPFDDLLLPPNGDV